MLYEVITSLLLARFGCQTEPRLWTPEPAEIRELTALIQRVDAIEKDIQREENRKEQAEISGVSETVMGSVITSYSIHYTKLYDS